MTPEQKAAYEWAKAQQFQSVAARYARTLAGLVDLLVAERDKLKKELAQSEMALENEVEQR